MDLIEGSEMSTIINQTPGNYSKESLLYSVHGESLKSRNTTYYKIENNYDMCFGGLGVTCWPLVPKFAGSNPAEDVGFLRAKKSSARLPSEGQ